MLQSAWERRFAFLPVALALGIFVVGAAGFVLTAGKPEYTQPVASLPDVVFAAPVPKELFGPPLTLAPIATAPSPLPDIVPIAEAIVPAPGPRPLVYAASDFAPGKVLAAPIAPPPWTSGFRAMQPPVLQPAATTTAAETPGNALPPSTDRVEAPTDLVSDSGNFAVVDAASNRQVVALTTGTSDQGAPTPVILPAETDASAAPSLSKESKGRGNSQAGLKSNGNGKPKND